MLVEKKTDTLLNIQLLQKKYSNIYAFWVFFLLNYVETTF